MAFKSILKPEGSLMAGIATAGLVYTVYQLNVGPVSSAQATDDNHPVLESSRKKAGYISFALVGILGLIAKDGNILTLGWGSVAVMELTYRHAIMANPQSGKMQNPSPVATFEPAQNVVPINVQGQNAYAS